MAAGACGTGAYVAAAASATAAAASYVRTSHQPEVLHSCSDVCKGLLNRTKHSCPSSMEVLAAMIARGGSLW